MSVVARFSVPADEFALGDVLEVRRGVQVRLETMIPTGAATVPYFWVATEDAAAVEAALRASSLVEDVRVVDAVRDETMFRVDWSTEVNGLVDAFGASGAVVLQGRGTGDSWSFRVRFPGHDALSDFYRGCVAEGIRIDLREVHEPPGADDGFGLTDDQREALSTALAAGYFEIPRETTLLELADRLGISDSAVSQRLRRGLATLLSEAGLAGSTPEDYRDGPDD